MHTYTQCLSDYTSYCWSVLCESLSLANTFIIEYFFHYKKKDIPTIHIAEIAQKMVIPRVKKSTLHLSLRLQYMNECVRCPPTLASAPAAAGCVRADSGCGRCNPVHG